MKTATRLKPQGFTIIELVVAILLLGILTATALPRFVDITSQAHTAVTKGVQDSLQTGTALFRAAWTTMGKPPGDTPITAFGDGSLRVNDQGYPKGLHMAGITNDIDGANECAQIYAKLLRAEHTPTISPTGLAAVPSSAQLNADTNDFIAYVTAPNVCNFIYSDEALTVGSFARVISYDSLSGMVTLGPSTALE